MQVSLFYLKGGFIIFEKIKKYILGFITCLMLVLIGVDNINYNNDTLIVNAQESNDMVYVGTPINPTGTYDKIYFNTNLTFEQIQNIFSNLTYFDDNGILTYSIYFNGEKSICISVVSELSIIYIQLYDSTIIYKSDEYGWNPDISNPLDYFLINGVNEVEGFPIGQQNELLSTIISSTPFEYVPISDTEWKGTAINPTGTYDKIYLNTSLSSDSIIDIVSNISQSDILGNYIIYANMDSANFLVLEYEMGSNEFFPNARASVYINLVRLLSFSNGEPEFEIITNFVQSGDNVSFNPDLINPYEYNLSGGVSEIDLSILGASGVIPVGNQNDYLSQLVSSTPFYRVLKVNNNNNELDGFVGGIFQDGNNALIGLSTLFASGVNALLGVFWVNGSLTILGIALAIGVGVGVIYFLFNFVRNWISRVKG